MNRKLLAILLTLSAVALTACGTDPGTNNTEGNAKANCGNGKIDANEACDGANLNGKTSCSAVDPTYTSGTLSCNNQCQFELKDCKKTTETPAPTTCDGKAIDAGEQCDGTHFPAGKTCSTETSGAKPKGNLKCNNKCEIDTSGCEKEDTPQPTVMKCDEAQKWFGKKDDKTTLVDGEHGKFTNDAGIGAARAKISTLTPGKDTVVDLDITGAVVTATEYNGKSAYVQDKDGALYIRLEGGKPNSFEPGTVVDFKITKARLHYGMHQAVAITGLNKTGTAKVMAMNLNEEDPGKTNDYTFVTMQGKLGTDGKGCGPKTCTTFTAYNDPSKKVLFRRDPAKISTVNDGDCIIYAGPLTYFKTDTQVDAENRNWVEKLTE